VWTDQEAKAFPFINRGDCKAAKNYGEKADILQLEILFSFGGLYTDCDVECLTPFDALCQTCDLFVGLCENINIEKARHSIIQRFLDNIKPGSGDNEPVSITSTTGPIAINATFFSQSRTI
jgi:mannosyltransferase OCH1-like enzyme